MRVEFYILCMHVDLDRDTVCAIENEPKEEKKTRKMFRIFNSYFILNSCRFSFKKLIFQQMHPSHTAHALMYCICTVQYAVYNVHGIYKKWFTHRNFLASS